MDVCYTLNSDSNKQSTATTFNQYPCALTKHTCIIKRSQFKLLLHIIYNVLPVFAKQQRNNRVFFKPHIMLCK